MLRRDPNGVASWLTRRGMWISGISAEQRAALEYLMLESHIVERVTRTRSTGWIKIGAERAFVLPTETIGASGAERIILDQHAGAAYAQRGTLEEWRDNIAAPAANHLMVRFSISASLAGPLLDLGGFESGILNFWGRFRAGQDDHAQDCGVVVGIRGRRRLPAGLANHRQRYGGVLVARQRHSIRSRRAWPSG